MNVCFQLRLKCSTYVLWLLSLRLTRLSGSTTWHKICYTNVHIANKNHKQCLTISFWFFFINSSTQDVDNRNNWQIRSDWNFSIIMKKKAICWSLNTYLALETINFPHNVSHKIHRRFRFCSGYIIRWYRIHAICLPVSLMLTMG